VSAANAVKAAMAVRRGWNLTTSRDSDLGLCDACGCVNALKVHVGSEIILKHMPREDFDALDKNCWIRSESQKQ
jgi:hypothetical protein